MSKSIPHLQKGDLIYIVSPAKAIEKEAVDFAKTYFENAGFKVKIGKNALGNWNYFSGTDEERLSDLQTALDDIECKAIICSRGGYGAIRIVDKINWDGFSKNPKWLCGFSDITVLLSKIHQLGFSSLHSTMPLNFKENSEEALDSLLNALTGKENHFHFPSSTQNIKGNVKGELIGGNLSIVYSLLGTPLQFDFSDKILFLEDIGEQLYAIDRMFFSLAKAGVFNQIKGLTIGGMTNLKDTEIPTLFAIQSIIKQHVSNKFPVCFDFPVGHISDNRAMIIGQSAALEIGEKEVVFIQ